MESCNLVGIAFPYEIVKMQDNKYGFSTATYKIDLSGFICRGFDVCDFGLFSALGNPLLGRDKTKLFPESELVEALNFGQIANVFDRQHFPSVVAKVYSLK